MQDPQVGETPAMGEDRANEGASGDWSGGERGRKRAGAAAASSLNRRGEEAVLEAKEALRGAKERVSAVYDRTAGEASRAYRGAREYAQENPGIAALATFAAGLGVGVMLTARGALKGYRRGLVPMTAVALAHAVLDVFGDRR